MPHSRCIFVALLVLGRLAAVVDTACTSATWNYFPPDASRECNGSGALWYPLDTGIPNATCICSGVAKAAVVPTANMDPTNNPGGIFGVQKPKIVNIDANGGTCMNADWGGGSFTRRWYADCYEGSTLSLSVTRDQVIHIVDTTPPVAQLTSAPLTHSECKFPVQMSARDPPTCTDNCDQDVDFIYDSYAIIGFCASETIVVRNWTCIDGCDNKAVLSQYEAFVDTLPPSITINFPSPSESAGDTTCCTTHTTPGCSTGIATQSDQCDYTLAQSTPDYVDTNYTDECGTVHVNRTWSTVDCASNPAEFLQKFIVEIAAGLNSLNSELHGLNGAVKKQSRLSLALDDAINNHPFTLHSSHLDPPI